MSEPLRIDLTGLDPALFDRLFGQLQAAIVDVAEALAIRELSPVAQDSIGEVLGAAQTFLEAKLKEPSLKNKRLLAEITEAYARAERELAAAKKARAEAEGVELDNLQRRLALAMEAMTLLGKVRLERDDDGLTLDFTE